MAEVTIQVNPTEDTESLLERVLETGSKEVILVLPAHPVALATLDNFYIFRRKMHEEGINLTFLGGDKTTRGLAKILGYKVIGETLPPSEMAPETILPFIADDAFKPLTFEDAQHRGLFNEDDGFSLKSSGNEAGPFLPPDFFSEVSDFEAEFPGPRTPLSPDDFFREIPLDLDIPSIPSPVRRPAPSSRPVPPRRADHVTLEVGPAETLDNLIKRILSIGFDKVTLVLPEKVQALQTLEHFQRLRKEVGQEAGIELTFSGFNRTGRGLAKILGFRVEAEKVQETEEAAFQGRIDEVAPPPASQWSTQISDDIFDRVFDRSKPAPPAKPGDHFGFDTAETGDLPSMSYEEAAKSFGGFERNSPFSFEPTDVTEDEDEPLVPPVSDDTASFRYRRPGVRRDLEEPMPRRIGGAGPRRPLSKNRGGNPITRREQLFLAWGGATLLLDVVIVILLWATRRKGQAEVGRTFEAKLTELKQQMHELERKVAKLY